MYKIRILPDASDDMDNLSDTIKYAYHAPETAFRYMQGVIDTMNILKQNAHIYQIQTRTSLQQYGQNVRRINYKKMAIIYTIHGSVVYIHRIVAASLIAGL
jgi:mRNA-degrading endonuclease RelE of RelBE toxin-antitoxin system